ncbi:ArnT family glycosyltransferase [Thermodesulfobacteriota bacterium]
MGKASMSFKKLLFVLIILFLLSFIVNLIFVFYFPRMDSDSHLYDIIGWNLIQGNGYSISLEPPHSPSFMRPLAYPTILAGIYSLFGRNSFFVYFFQAVLLACTAPILFLITRQVFDDTVAGLAAVLHALNPFVAFYTSTVMTEITATFFLTLTILFCIHATSESQSRPIRYLIAAAISLGLLANTRSGYEYFILFAFIIVFLSFRPLKNSIQNGIIIVVVFLAIIGPAVYRTHHHFGKWKIYDGSVGWTLYGATLEYRDSSWDELIRESDSEPDAVIIMNSTDYREVHASFERFYQRAIENIKDDPSHYLKTVMIRFFRVWFSSYMQGLHPMALMLIKIVGILFLGLGIFGITLSLASWRDLIWIYAMLFFTSALHSLITTQARYTIPARGLMTIFVAFSLVKAWSFVKGGRVE